MNRNDTPTPPLAEERRTDQTQGESLEPDAITVLKREVASPRASRDELEKDKTRLDWLEANSCTEFPKEPWVEPATAYLRSAIDAAMKDQQP